MGNGPTKELVVPRNLKRKAEAARKDASTKFVLLLLGAGSAGKSTILKQIQLLHGSGFNDNQRKSFREQIALTLLRSTLTVIDNCTHQRHPLESKTALNAAKVIQDAVEYFQDVKTQTKIFSDAMISAIKQLNEDPQFVATLKERDEYALEDTYPELVKKLYLKNWGGKGWVPDNSDILLTRVRTTGAVRANFSIEGAKFMLIDVGGQRAERKKWVELFEGVHGVLFVAALSEYNQVLFEESSANRLIESVNLFKEYGNRKEFEDSALLLFLNKFDLFQQKYYYDNIPLFKPNLAVADAESEIPDPPKAEEEKDAKCYLALEWFEKLFVSQINTRKRTEVYTHVTCALDTNQMDAVFKACSTFILQQSLQSSGLLLKK